LQSASQQDFEAECEKLLDLPWGEWEKPAENEVPPEHKAPPENEVPPENEAPPENEVPPGNEAPPEKKRGVQKSAKCRARPNPPACRPPAYSPLAGAAPQTPEWDFGEAQSELVVETFFDPSAASSSQDPPLQVETFELSYLHRVRPNESAVATASTTPSAVLFATGPRSNNICMYGDLKVKRPYIILFRYCLRSHLANSKTISCSLKRKRICCKTRLQRCKVSTGFLSTLPNKMVAL